VYLAEARWRTGGAFVIRSGAPSRSAVFTRATLSLREPPTTRSACALASPLRTSSTMSVMVKPCAIMSPFGQAARVAASGEQFEDADAVSRLLAGRHDGGAKKTRCGATADTCSLM
jgi:hypothetical protein